MNATSPLLPTTLALADGQTVTVRPIRLDDASRLVEMYHHLSDRTRRLRFHTYLGDLPKERIWREAIALSDLDPTRQVALVAVLKDDQNEQVVGVARFARATADAIEAEAAIVVRDDYQGLGLGTHLMAQLIPLARSMDIRQFVGWVMSDNAPMMKIINKGNLPMRRETRSGETLVVVSLEP